MRYQIFECNLHLYLQVEAMLLRALLRLKVSFFFGDAWLKETFCFF